MSVSRARNTRTRSINQKHLFRGHSRTRRMRWLSYSSVGILWGRMHLLQGHLRTCRMSSLSYSSVWILYILQGHSRTHRVSWLSYLVFEYCTYCEVIQEHINELVVICCMVESTYWEVIQGLIGWACCHMLYGREQLLRSHSRTHVMNLLSYVVI